MDGLAPEQVAALRDVAARVGREALRAELKALGLKLGARLRLENELCRSAAAAADSAGAAAPSGSMPTHDEVCRALRGALLGEEPRDWSVQVAPSSVEGAGEGVWLRGACAAGSVVAVYPGLVFAGSSRPLLRMVFRGNGYLLKRREDGVYIDARPDGPSRSLFDVARKREEDEGGTPFVEAGELSVGHKVNHPPGGVRPNVRVRAFDLHAGEHAELHRLLPVANARRPADGEPCKRTVIFLATRALRDEELFLDYEYGSKDGLPAWYTPVAGEAG